MAAAHRGIFRALGRSIRLPHHRSLCGVYHHQSPAAQLPTADLDTSSCSPCCLQPCPCSLALPHSRSEQASVCGLSTPVRGSRSPWHCGCALPCCIPTGTDVIARVSAIAASRVSRDLTVSANETGGFKYVPGGRKSIWCIGCKAFGLIGSYSEGHGQ